MFTGIKSNEKTEKINIKLTFQCPTCDNVALSVDQEAYAYRGKWQLIDINCPKCHSFYTIEGNYDSDKFNNLDAAARANLGGKELEEFFKYRDMLKADGHSWENDAEWILEGYLWDVTEERD